MKRTLCRISATAILSSVCLFQPGCASTSLPPKSAAKVAASPAVTPRTEAPAALAAAPTESTPAQATTESGQDDSPKSVDEPGDGLRKASRPPLDMLTGNNVVYVLNFVGSKVGTSAKERCESQNSDDPAAARDCLVKERSKLPVESVRFVKSASGEYWWVTYNRYKGNLLKWHSIQFTPGKADADSVSLALMGKDKGIAPLGHVPHSLDIELPNDYSIVLSDPEYGALLFDAKIGLLEPDQPE